MQKRKLTLLALCIMSYFSAHAQVITPNQLISIYSPEYMATGGTSRMATYFHARINGLNSGETYYYTVSACASSDIGKSFAGVGGSLYLNADSPTIYEGSPDFTAGKFDSFTVINPMSGLWFGLVNSTDARFDAGKYIYPLVTIKSADPMSGFSVRFSLNDSIKMLAFNTSAGANNGTGIYGISEGNSKEMVLVYDTSKPTGRPLTIGMIEDDKLAAADYNVPAFYTTNVDAKAGVWGGMLPNTLSNGIRRIDRLAFADNTIEHTLLDTNGVLLSVNTKNPNGGSSTPIKLTKDEAALVPTKVEFVQPFVNVNEGADSFKVQVRRLYATEDTAKITLSLVGGSATNVLDYNIGSSYTFEFAPGPAQVDTFTFPIVDDSLTEGSEVLTLKIVNPINTTRGKDSVQSITIIDNDIPVINFIDTTIVTREGLGDAIANISIAKGTAGTTTVQAVIKSTSALTSIPGEFYLSVNTSNDTTVSFSNGLAADTFKLNGFIIDETSIDAPDTIWIVLRNPSGNATLGPDSTLRIIVKDDDAPPGVRFITPNQTVTEDVGSIDVQIELLNRNNNPSDFSLKFVPLRSDVTEGSDFTFSPTSKIYSFGTSGPDTITVNVPIINDDVFEMNERLIFSVEGTVNCLTYAPDTLRLFIESEDKEKVSIASASNTNLATGVALRLNEDLSISGVTHGFNRSSSGNEFTVIDATGGMQVSSSNRPFGYTFAEGDSITVIGKVTQSNGVTQMSTLDTIIKHKSNATLAVPSTINKLSELSEQEHIRIANLKFIDLSAWPSSALSADQEAMVHAVNNIGDTINIRIDAEGSIDGTAIPDINKYYNIIGLGSQNDPTSPYLSNYYIDPSRISDIELVNSPTVGFTDPVVNVAETEDSTGFLVVSFANFGFQNVGFSIVDAKTGTATSPKDYSFTDINLNVLASVSSFTFRVDLNDDIDVDGDKTILIALRKPKYGVLIGADSILTINLLDNESNITSLAKAGIKVYPNPASNKIKIGTAKTVKNIQIFDTQGKLILAQKSALNNELNIATLPKGLYQLVLSIDGVTYSSSFLKK